MKFSLRVLLNFESLGLFNFSGDKFDFGTSAEDASGVKVFFTSWKPAPQKLHTQGGGGKGVDGGLAHPKLFGDQAKREKRWNWTLCKVSPFGERLNFCRFLERVFALRQAALAGKSKWSRVLQSWKCIQNKTRLKIVIQVHINSKIMTASQSDWRV